MVGDYDASGLYAKACEAYENISHALVAEYNDFLGDLPERRLERRETSITRSSR